MSNELVAFDFNGSQLDYGLLNGEPVFNLNYVGNLLGLSNPSMSIDTSDPDYVVKLDNSVLSFTYNRNLNNRGELFLTESGLYRLLMRSNKPEAEAFQKWIAKDVLPAIHKYGVYATPATVDALLNNPDMLFDLMDKWRADRAKMKELSRQNAIKDQQIAEMQPKVTYYSLVLQSQDTVPISVIAKDYGWSARHMNDFLKEKGIQYKQGSQWLLKQKYADKGYTQSKTYQKDNRTFMNTNWTQSGRLFLYDLLKSNGILPQIERNVNK